MEDKFPCATCEDLPTCEETLKWASLGMALEKEGFPVTEVCITCPKDGFTYTAKRKASKKENDGSNPGNNEPNS